MMTKTRETPGVGSTKQTDGFFFSIFSWNHSCPSVTGLVEHLQSILSNDRKLSTWTAALRERAYASDKKHEQRLEH